MDMNKLVQESLKDLDVNEMFKNKIKSKIEEAVDSAVNEQMGHWGSFKKSLDEAVKDKMKFDPDKLDLSSYNNFMSDQCAEILKECMSEERALKIKDSLKDKLNITSKEEWEFEDLIEFISDTFYEAIDNAHEDDPCACDDLPAYTIECKQDFKYDWFKIKIYEGDENVYSSSCEADLTVTKDGKSLSSHSKSFHNPISRMFQAMAYKRVKINNIEETEVKIRKNREDYY